MTSPGEHHNRATAWPREPQEVSQLKCNSLPQLFFFKLKKSSLWVDCWKTDTKHHNISNYSIITHLHLQFPGKLSDADPGRTSTELRNLAGCQRMFQGKNVQSLVLSHLYFQYFLTSPQQCCPSCRERLMIHL